MARATIFTRMSPYSRRLWRPAILLGAAVVMVACGSAPPPSPAPAPIPVSNNSVAAPAVAPEAAEASLPRSAPPPVFAEYASRMMVVFPLQRFAAGDSGWLAASGATGRPRAALLDSALTAVLRERGLATVWSLPDNTSRVSQREVMNRTDPRGLATAGLVPSRRPNDTDLREPLGSQLRAIIAMLPESRMVLVPLEMRVANTRTGARQATLRLALIDGRMSTVVSFPDVTGAAAVDERAAIRAAAEKFADLVIIP